jgi:hypothetical protein
MNDRQIIVQVQQKFVGAISNNMTDETDKAHNNIDGTTGGQANSNRLSLLVVVVVVVVVVGVVNFRVDNRTEEGED